MVLTTTDEVPTDTETETPVTPPLPDTGDEGRHSPEQYVTFHLDQEAYALPMAAVLEIIRVPETVRVPLTPPSLVGLANLRGSVLPVLDLRRMLGLPFLDYGDSTRAVVVDTGRPVGLVVDRVARVLDVDHKSIEPAEDIRATIDAHLLNGVAKNIDGHELIQLLDVDKALQQEFATVIAMAAAAADGADLSSGQFHSNTSDDDATDDLRQLVSFVVDSQEYAFDITEVEEIVRVPDEISRVPRTSSHVLGLINLRGQLLPLVSLRRMFALGEREVDEDNRILVVNIPTEGGRRGSVGIVVDRIREVFSIGTELQDDVPALLRQDRDLDEIESVCRLDGGDRLVSVISATALFNHPAIQQAQEACEEQAQETGMETHTTGRDLDADEDEETQLVVFQLAGQEFGVPIDSVQEITRVPDDLTRVPRTPEFIDGLVNLRGAVLPVIDMRVRFGLERMAANDRQRILVLDLGHIRTGFTTDAVLEVLRLPRALIEQSPELSEEQSRIMGRVVNFREQKRMIQVLAVDQLLDRREIEQINDAL